MGLKPINTMIFERIWYIWVSENGATPAMVILINDHDPMDLGVPSFQTTWDSHFRVENEKNSPDSHCFGHWRIPWFWSLENTMILIIGEYHDSDHLTWSQWELTFWSSLYYQEPPTKNGQFGGPSKSLVLIPHDLWLVGGNGQGWTGWSIKHAGIIWDWTM